MTIYHITVDLICNYYITGNLKDGKIPRVLKNISIPMESKKSKIAANYLK